MSQHVGSAETDFLHRQLHLTGTKVCVSGYSIFTGRNSIKAECAIRIRLRGTNETSKRSSRRGWTQIYTGPKVLRQGLSFDSDSSWNRRWRNKCKHYTIDVRSSYVHRSDRYWRSRRRLIRLRPAIKRQLRGDEM